MTAAPTVATRKPTGRPSYPLVLVEGEEFAGKTWAAAELSASPRVGRTFWLDLGEGTADEYAAIPGAEYEVLTHDGSWASIIERVDEVRAFAKWASTESEKPTVLVIDTGTDLWEGLKDWVTERAKGSNANKRKLAVDPAAQLDISRNLWNDAGTRYRRLMTKLLTFPGVVVMTARGKVVSATAEDGQPARDGSKDYRVESHKTLPYDASVWVRMSRTGPPIIVGARSVTLGVRPGKDEPQPILDETLGDNPLLEWVIFTALGVDPEHTTTRTIASVRGGDLTDDERVAEEEETGEPAPPKTTRQEPAAPAQGAQQAQAAPQAQPAAQPVTGAPSDKDVAAVHRAAAKGLAEPDVALLKRTYDSAKDAGLLGVDVAAELSADHRDAMAIPGDAPVPFGQLLIALAGYINKHGLTVAAALEPPPAAPTMPVEDPPYDPWPTTDPSEPPPL